MVLYDNLIEDYPRDQVRSVVAHELGHVHSRDVPRGLLWLAIVALPGTLLVQRGRADRARAGPRPAPAGGPAALPALALSLALVASG